MIALEAVLRRERTIVGAGLAALVALAWLHILHGAGMGMSALDMTSATFFPHLQAEVAGDMDASWPVIVAMWWVMMIAMMTPSAAPLVLLHARVLRHRADSDPPSPVPSALLAGGYLFAWLLFSIAAAGVQEILQPASMISGMMLWSKNAALSATLLAAAGLYQLSPLKQACLRQCRGPAQFLTRFWRPGKTGAFLLGVRHGAYCVGCCWMLMALLFVGGVMNVVWIAGLAIFVLIEKLAPAGPLVGKLTGYLLILWAAATLAM